MCLYTWYLCIQATVQVRLKLNVMYYYPNLFFFSLFRWLSQSRSKSFLDSWQVPVSPQLHFFQPEGELHFETCRKKDACCRSHKMIFRRFFTSVKKPYKASLFQGNLRREALQQKQCGCFLKKKWYPTTMGFPTKHDQLWGVLGVPVF